MGASGGDSMSVAFAVTVPIMTNAVDVKSGEEWLLQITPTRETKRKEGSWKDDVAKAAKAPNVKAKAKPQSRLIALELPTEI